MSAEAQRSLLSVLIPIFSPAPQLAELHRELLPCLEKLGVDFEVLYLLGTTCSETTEVLRRAYDEEPRRVRVLQFAAASGEAAMLSAGIQRSCGQVLLTLPARFETNLSAIGELHEAVCEGADLAFAARRRGSTGTPARLQSEIFNRFVSWAAGMRFRDIASGMRAIRREVLDEIPLYGDFHRYLPVLAQRAGFRVRELPAHQHPRATAPLIHRPAIYLWRLIDILSVFFISRFTRHPLRLFGGLGAAFLAAGSAILLVIGIERLAGTPLAGRPILVLGTLLVGLGVQVFAIGLLGELMVFFQARSIRDYRVRDVYQGSASRRSALKTSEAESESSSGHGPAEG